MRLNITYSTSNQYVKYAGVSIISLCENNINVDEIYIFFIGDSIDEKNRTLLKSLVTKYRRHIEFLDINVLSRDIEDKNNMSKTTYGKLFLADILDCDKILHIDSDTLIQGSLEKIWSINIDEYLIAGVLDCVNDYNRILIGMKPSDKYINGGVVLFNLQKWRKQGLCKRATKLYKNNKGNIPNYDQGIINCLCKNQILVLEPQYNLLPHMLTFTSNQIKSLYQFTYYYSDMQLQNALKNPVIIHFVTHIFDRPWNEKSTHPFKELYLEYLNLSPWGSSLERGKLKTSIRLRKKAYKYLPFMIYLLLEKQLYARRKRLVENNYKYIENNDK